MEGQHSGYKVGTKMPVTQYDGKYKYPLQTKETGAPEGSSDLPMLTQIHWCQSWTLKLVPVSSLVRFPTPLHLPADGTYSSHVQRAEAPDASVCLITAVNPLGCNLERLSTDPARDSDQDAHKLF